MKRFGRARELSRLRRVAWVALDFGYRGGWPASLARRFGVTRLSSPARVVVDILAS